jgi:hypothetical protein
MAISQDIFIFEAVMQQMNSGYLLQILEETRRAWVETSPLMRMLLCNQAIVLWQTRGH